VDPTDVAPAIRALRRALALDSTNTNAWHFLALSLAESGDVDGAFAAWRRAIDVAPADLQGLTFQAIADYWRRQYDSSMGWADSAIALDPSYQMTRVAAGFSEVERGDYARARAAFDAAARLSTGVETINVLAGQALTAARAGSAGEARGLLQRAESLAATYAPTPLHTAVYLAEAHAGLGDAEGAIAWLERYRPGADLHFQLHLRCDPPFEPIENDPRFRSLLLRPRPGGTRGC
jgi:tetratricopeptide (TPR) repeat protein